MVSVLYDTYWIGWKLLVSSVAYTERMSYVGKITIEEACKIRAIRMNHNKLQNFPNRYWSFTVN